MIWDELDLTKSEYKELRRAGMEWEVEEGRGVPDGYCAYIPESVDPNLLKKHGWKAGRFLRVSIRDFENEDEFAL